MQYSKSFSTETFVSLLQMISNFFFDFKRTGFYVVTRVGSGIYWTAEIHYIPVADMLDKTADYWANDYRLVSYQGICKLYLV